MKPACSALALLLLSAPAFAESAGDTTLKTDEIVYDKNTGKLSTIGRVDMDYGENKITAKSVEFDSNTHEITAPDQIDMSSPHAKIDTIGMSINTQTKNARIGETNVEFGEHSYAKARGAEMFGREKIVLEGAEYTACREGLRDCGETPTWKLYATSVVNYPDTGLLVYRNAMLYMWDVPVFWLPFLRSYTPNVKNRTGFLVPSFGTSSNLGYVLQLPFFVKLNDYNDMTITPMLTSKQGQLFIGEYRTNQSVFSSTTGGSYKGSTETEERRWHLKSHNYFEIDSVWRGKLNVERASDDTYLRLYDFSTDPWLLSQAGLEGVSGRSYMTANLYSWQDLRDMKTWQNPYTPAVLPVVNYRRITEPMRSGGFLDMNLNAAHIIRDYSAMGVKDEEELRTSALVRYNQPLSTSGGHMFNLGLSARSDLYSLSDIHTDGGTYYSGSEGRGTASADITWKYPLIRRRSDGSDILEPTIQVIASPKKNANPRIPNMDSKYMELEVENLFSDNRFSGYDVLESGSRANYGAKLTRNYAGAQSLTLFLGQNYNISVPEDIYLENSGLRNGSGFSDLVASATYSPASYLKLGYKSRMSNDNLAINRNDFNIYMGGPALNATINYVYLRNMYIEDDLPVRKDEINAYLSSQLTRRWRAFFGNRYDLTQRRDINIIGGIAFENDCFQFKVNMINEFTRDRDYTGDKSIYISLTFRTLGTISTGFGMGAKDKQGGAETGAAAP